MDMEPDDMFEVFIIVAIAMASVFIVCVGCMFGFAFYCSRRRRVQQQGRVFSGNCSLFWF